MNEKSRPYYDEPVAAAAEPEIDPRVTAMQRVVDAEKRAEYMRREVERRQKEAAVAPEELEQARGELRELLGISGVTDGGNKRADW